MHTAKVLTNVIMIRLQVHGQHKRNDAVRSVPVLKYRRDRWGSNWILEELFDDFGTTYSHSGVKEADMSKKGFSLSHFVHGHIGPNVNVLY